MHISENESCATQQELCHTTRAVPHNNLAADRTICVGRVSSNLPQTTKMVERADKLNPPPPPPKKITHTTKISNGRAGGEGR